MKKLSLICMAALLWLAASCKKEDKTGKDIGFVATTESHAGDSKTHLSDKAVLWDLGDKIRVHSLVAAADLAQGWWDFKATGVDGKKADFTGVNENDFECVPQGFYIQPYTAVYPAEMVSAIGDKTCTISLPQAQTYVSDGFDLSANPMMAYSGTTTLNFKNICGLVEMKFYGEEACKVDNITLISDDAEEMLWGSATVEFGDVPTTSPLSGGGNTITLDCNGMELSTNPDDPSVFHFVVPANTLARGFKVQILFTGSDENVCEKHAPAGAAVGRSQILAMPVLSVAVKDPVVPSEVTLTGIDPFTRIANCSMTIPEGSEITEFGLLYNLGSEATDPDINHCDGKIAGVLSSKASASDVTKAFTVDISDLKDTYRVRAYAKIEGAKYSATETYTYTPITPNEVTITNINPNTHIAICKMDIHDSSTPTSCGIVYSTSSTSPTIDHCDGNISGEMSGIDKNKILTFTVNISSLTTQGVTYHLRAYAKIEDVKYSEYQNYYIQITPSEVAITTTIDSYTREVSCTVTFPTGSSLTEYGLVYSTTNTSPTTADVKIQSHNLSGNTFTVDISSLTGADIYHMRAYAIIEGTGYSSTQNFQYQAITPSEVTITGIDQNTHVATCTVTIPYGSLTEYGLVYSTSNTTPTPTDGMIESHNLSGNTFTVDISSLTEDCYVRAYAKIEGAAYSSTQTYTPLKPSQVTLVSGLDNITNTVTCGVTFPQGSSITECGLVYSTTDETPTIAEGATKIASTSLSGNTFTVSSSSLTGTDLYYVRAYAKIGGVTYSETKTYSTVPLPCSWAGGKSPYPFTVGSGKQVYFSSGNLQYLANGGSSGNASETASTGYNIGGTWRFAQHQYDFIGENNKNLSQTCGNWIDLFGWGTSGCNTGQSSGSYKPWFTNSSNASYNPYNATNKNLYDKRTSSPYCEGLADWGKANMGTNWRVLTSAEKTYLFNTRTNHANLYGLGVVAGTKGLILLPDNWSLPTGCLTFVSGETDWSNVYSYTQWALMEEKGAVFLPAAGKRSGTTVSDISIGSEKGYYWTSSYSNSGTSNFKASAFSFGSKSVSWTEVLDRYLGHSVRLVSDN